MMRLKSKTPKLFKKNGNDSFNFENTNWINVLDYLDEVLKGNSQKKVIFLINSEIDLESLAMLNTIESKYPSRIQIRSLDEEYKNTYFSWNKK